ncbi:MAG: L,D-transpeptidase family protein [Clostridiales bacterium]|nr:L,D-transpeptidase family protein [Clostridiales bacterium]
MRNGTPRNTKAHPIAAAGTVRALALALIAAALLLPGCEPASPPAGATDAPATGGMLTAAATATGAPQTPAQSPANALTPTPSPSTPSPTETPRPAETCYIHGDGVRIRAQAGTDAEILCTLPYGTRLNRIERGQEWSKVQYGETTGYIRNDLLSDTAPQPRPTQAVQRVDNPRIVVRKSERKLELWDGDTLAGRYAVGLGWTPEGHKKAEGDGRTPEGEYYVCMRNSHSSFYLSLGVSYPNKEDARAALDEGRISRDTYNEIAAAIDGGRRPPWNTSLGGEIMIHGHGGDRDWTAGCVGVDDEVMDILWDACPLGTPITILP